MKEVLVLHLCGGLCAASVQGAREEAANRGLQHFHRTGSVSAAAAAHPGEVTQPRFLLCRAPAVTLFRNKQKLSVVADGHVPFVFVVVLSDLLSLIYRVSDEELFCLITKLVSISNHKSAVFH